MTRMETKNDTKRPLPNGWRWVKLGEVIREAQAGFACGLRDPQGIAQLRMNNLDTRGNFVWDDVLRVPHEATDIEQFLIVPGDVLFNNTNSTELVGKSALFDGYVEPIVYSNHFTRLRTVTEALLPDLLASWLNHQWQQGAFAAICNRWIGQSAVKADKLLNLDFPLPPLSEQRRIAEVLREQMAAAEKARAAAQARLEAVKALPAAFLRQIFPQPGQPLPASWYWVKLGEVATVISGQHILESDYNHDGRGIGYLTGPADFGVMKPAITKWTETPRVLCEPMDVLVTVKGAGVGKINLSPDVPVAIGRQLMAMRGHHGSIDTMFLFSFLITRFNYFQENAMGATVPGLSRGDLETLVTPLPPFEEQQRIAEVLHEQMAAMEKVRAATEEELATINALPAALLRRAFSGEI